MIRDLLPCMHEPDPAALDGVDAEFVAALRREAASLGSQIDEPAARAVGACARTRPESAPTQRRPVARPTGAPSRRADLRTGWRQSAPLHFAARH